MSRILLGTRPSALAPVRGPSLETPRLWPHTARADRAASPSRPPHMAPGRGKTAAGNGRRARVPKRHRRKPRCYSGEAGASSVETGARTRAGDQRGGSGKGGAGSITDDVVASQIGPVEGATAPAARHAQSHPGRRPRAGPEDPARLLEASCIPQNRCSSAINGQKSAQKSASQEFKAHKRDLSRANQRIHAKVRPIDGRPRRAGPRFRRGVLNGEIVEDPGRGTPAADVGVGPVRLLR